MSIYKYIFQYLPLIFFVYIYFFDPIQISIGGRYDSSIELLYIAALLFWCAKSRIIRNFYSVFHTEFWFIAYFVSFSIFRFMVGGDAVMMTGMLKLMLTSFLIPCFIVYLLFKININNEEKFVKFLLLVGALAAISTLICLLYPEVNSIYKSQYLILDSGGDVMEGFRGFGFSSKLTSDFGYIQGALLALGLVFIGKYKWFIPIVPIVFISTILNARTGVIITGIGIISFMIHKNVSIKTLFSFCVLYAIAVTMPIWLNSLLQLFNVSDKTLSWIDMFLVGMTDTFQNKKLTASDTGDALFSDMWLLPESLVDWIMGCGFTLFKAGHHSGGNSDIGFINQLNYGGLIFFVPLMVYFFKMFKRLNAYGYFNFSLLFVLSFLVLNIKSGFALKQGGALGFFLIIYYFLILLQHNQKK